jgi:hypothetical protein
MWWLSQEDAARKALSENPVPLRLALLDLRKWVLTQAPAGVWGNGATADNVWIKSAFQIEGILCPWTHKQDRCYRTLKAMLPSIEAPPFIGTEHNALVDAVNQMAHLKLLLAALRG